MASNESNVLQQYIDGNISEQDIRARLAPGCTLEDKDEKETRPVAGKPIEHWKRSCTRITGCEDPSDNGGWVCRPWEFDY